MKMLGSISKDNIYTNLGLLLSDQCMHTVKVAVFSGVSKSEFKDRREFGGSLLKQMTTTYEFIDLHNRIKAEFVGFNHIDHRDYPEEALREAEELLKVGQTMAGRVLKEMVKNELLIKEGKAVNTRYFLL